MTLPVWLPPLVAVLSIVGVLVAIARKHRARRQVWPPHDVITEERRQKLVRLQRRVEYRKRDRTQRPRMH